MLIAQRMYSGVLLPVEVDRRVVTGLLPAMRSLLGFTGYTTVDFERGRFGTFTEYRERAAAEVVCSATPGAIRSIVADLIPSPPVSSIGAVLCAERLEGMAGYLVHRAYAGCSDAGVLGPRMIERLPDLMQAAPGLRGSTVMDMGDGHVVWLILFDTYGHAESCRATVDSIVKQHMADLLPFPPDAMTGKVLSEIRDG